MGEIKATPRNKLGPLVDALRGVNQFAAKNKYTNMAAELIGTPAIERTLDRVSYGEPITNIGKANVPLIPEDTGEAAMALAPMAMSAGKALVKASPKAQAAALRMMDNAMAPATLGKQRGSLLIDSSIDDFIQNATKGKKIKTNYSKYPSESLAKNPYDMGVINNYPEKDIQGFYLRRNGYDVVTDEFDKRKIAKDAYESYIKDKKLSNVKTEAGPFDESRYF